MPRFITLFSPLIPCRLMRSATRHDIPPLKEKGFRAAVFPSLKGKFLCPKVWATLVCASACSVTPRYVTALRAGTTSANRPLTILGVDFRLA